MKNMADKRKLAISIIAVVLVLIIVLIIAVVCNGVGGKKEEESCESSNTFEAEEDETTTKNETTVEDGTTIKNETTVKNESTIDDETTVDDITTTTSETTTKEETTKKEEPTTEQETTSKKDEEKEDEVVTSTFSHPGILHSTLSFEYMTYAVNNSITPNIDTWNVLLSTGFSNASWNPRPLETVIRGGNGDNVAQLYIDVARAYQCALIWKVSGSEAHGEAACRILNAWSGTLKTVTGNADRYLASGLFGYQLANASEIMRDHPDFKLEQMQNMLYTVFYKPLNERFLTGNEYGYPHNDAYFQNYWANWDLCNIASAMAIGIFCDNEEAYNVGLQYFINGIGNGSIYNAMPYVHEDGTVQWQESGRDQGHTNLGVGLMACILEMAWNQGDDLYSWGDNRFLKAAEYVAKYNNGEDVLFSEYEWGSGRNGDVKHHTVVSEAGRGEVRPIWSMIYNHYVNRMGLEAPNIKARLESFGNAEYGAGGHATTFDQPGWGTLTYAGNVGNTEATVPKRNIESGVYRIVSYHTGKSLKLCDDNVVRQCVKGSDDKDLWEFIDLGDGEFNIKNVKTGLMLSVAGDSHSNAANIIGWEANGKASQRFAILTADENNYRIIASNSGKALDIPWGSDDETLNLQQYRYTCLNFQKWYLEKVD